jgi:hypothetical protein
MGFVLSILYFVVYYLTPATLFGPLAAYRIELILAAIITFISLPVLPKSYLLKTSQSVALIGLAFAASFSVLFGMHWAWGAVLAFPAFIPYAFAYLLVCLHINAKMRLQILVAMLLFVCLFVIAHGYFDLTYRVSAGDPLQSVTVDSIGHNQWDVDHPYLFIMKNDAGETFYRLRGLGLINDPNDFGQLLVCVIPLIFIFWRAKSVLQNVAFVLLPVSALLFGMYLTHSRGALLALMAVAVVAAQRRIGILPALLLAVAVFATAMALHFTGGRDISADSGADRTALWSSGMEMLKSHPLFGVGLNSFADNCDGCGHTAHNSVVVCAAELGTFGFFFWCMFLFPTVRDALTIASPKKVSDVEQFPLRENISLPPMKKAETINKAEINRLGRLLVLSLTGFLVAGWFLSRTYILTFFLLGGLVEAVFEIALRQGMIAPRLPVPAVLRYSGVLALLLVLLMYIMLRMSNLLR